MPLADLHSEIADAFRVHHASGHFDHDTAHARLTAQTGCDAAEADRILAAPVPDRLYDEFKTYPPSLVRVPCDACDAVHDQALADVFGGAPAAAKESS
jgi:hypothetical protein